MKQAIVGILSVLLLLGCASIEKAEYMMEDEVVAHALEDHAFIVVKTRGIVTPSTTTVFLYDKVNKTFTKVEGGTGASALGVVAGPAATAYAGHEIGRGLREAKPDQTNISNKTNVKGVSGSAAGAAAGSISVSKSKAAALQAQGQGQAQGQAMKQAQGQAQQMQQLQDQAQDQEIAPSLC